MASPPTDLDGVRLRRRALPPHDRESVSLRTRLFGRSLEAPLVVITAERPNPRPPLLIAELDVLGGRDALWRAAELIEELDADALSIRLDPLKEAVRAETIAGVVGHVSPTPVMVRGATDFEDFAQLREIGVAAIGVAAEVEAITEARAAAPGLPLIVSGVRDGGTVAKCVALGATACAFDGPAEEVAEQLRIATWLAGASGVHELGRQHLR